MYNLIEDTDAELLDKQRKAMEKVFNPEIVVKQKVRSAEDYQDLIKNVGAFLSQANPSINDTQRVLNQLDAFGLVGKGDANVVVVDKIDSPTFKKNIEASGGATNAYVDIESVRQTAKDIHDEYGRYTQRLPEERKKKEAMIDALYAPLVAKAAAVKELNDKKEASLPHGVMLNKSADGSGYGIHAANVGDRSVLRSTFLEALPYVPAKPTIADEAFAYQANLRMLKAKKEQENTQRTPSDQMLDVMVLQFTTDGIGNTQPIADGSPDQPIDILKNFFAKGAGDGSRNRRNVSVEDGIRGGLSYITADNTRLQGLYGQPFKNAFNADTVGLGNALDIEIANEIDKNPNSPLKALFVFDPKSNQPLQPNNSLYKRIEVDGKSVLDVSGGNQRLDAAIAKLKEVTARFVKRNEKVFIAAMDDEKKQAINGGARIKANSAQVLRNTWERATANSLATYSIAKIKSLVANGFMHR
jgi:hypothetical protein